MKPTDTKNPEYFHKVVDCQYACPAHTPVPEYIRMIAAGRYSEAYMLNWESNVFPGVLGRTCDRPCEPACRRGRIEQEPVAICRLKRVAADNRGDVSPLMPKISDLKNGMRVAVIGAGPASLTVVRDLMPLGYCIDLYEDQPLAGGFMRSQIPSFRLPEQVLNEEVNYILDMGVLTRFNSYVDSLQSILAQNYDAVFVGTGAPLGRDIALPGREEGGANIEIGINWLASVAFEHTDKIGKKVLVLGGGNTAMDCCRTALRLGAEDVTVLVRSPRDQMKASAWEIEDAVREGIPVYDNHVPLEYVIEDGKLVGMTFDSVTAEYDSDGKRSLVSLGEEPVFFPCDNVLVAIGQENSFPWIERDIGLEFDEWGMPVVDPDTFQSTHEKVFFGGDAAFGPTNIITAVAHGHHAAVSIDLLLQDKSVKKHRPDPITNLVSQKMGIHEWSYDNPVVDDLRCRVPLAPLSKSLCDVKLEVELGFDTQTALKEAERCLNCDVQTVFSDEQCIECDACIDICPVDCLSFSDKHSKNISTLRQSLKIPATNLSQTLYISPELKTKRVMVKDENVCLHCGLCAERCPTTAWDMQQFFYQVAKAGQTS